MMCIFSWIQTVIWLMIPKNPSYFKISHFQFEISSTSFVLCSHIPYGFTQLIYLEIHVVDTQMNDLVCYGQCNMLWIQHNKNYFLPLNNVFGLSLYRSIFDFFKIFRLSSSNSLSFFWDNNSCIRFSGTFVITNCTVGNTFLSFNSGRM